MAVVSVPRPLRDQLGDAAADSLVDMLRHFEDDQEQRRAIQKEHLFEVLDERFLRHLAETEERLHEEIGALRAEVGKEIGDVRKEIGALRAEVGKEIGDVRTDLGKEIGALRTDLGNQIADVRKDLGDVRKEITVQTRWILAVIVAATVLFPVMQRVMAALLP